MTFTDAAREVLRLSGRPLHYKEITELAIEQNLLSHVGKSPEVTMGARLAATLKKGGDDNPLIRVKPGVFALRDWDEETIKKGLEIKRAPRRKKKAEPAAEEAPKAAAKSAAKEKKAKAESSPPAPSEEPQAEEPAAPKAAKPAAKKASEPAPAAPAQEASTSEEESPSKAAPKVDLSATPPAPDEEMRADLAASAAEVFAAEDDDDQPILKPRNESNEGGDGRRRRRRRRRRGSRSNGEQDRSGLPSYTAAPAFDGDSSGARGPQVIELAPSEIPSLDGAAGHDLSNAVFIILSTFDRTVGAVSLRQIAETAQRRGKLTGDIQLAQSQIAAAVRADNARRQSLGMRPRFRTAGGRVGLTDWLLDGDLQRYERELQAALRRYRDAARKAFASKCAELPGHAFVELCVSVVARMGVGSIKGVKFPGASGAEAHFSGVLHTPAGMLPGALGEGAGLPLALLIRKDGRDLGRERVTEVRGNAHHYGNATMGWMFTSGQVLSGAREEAGANTAMPVTLIDGIALARLCEEHNVAVVRASHPVAIADVDLFEALRSS